MPEYWWFNRLGRGTIFDIGGYDDRDRDDSHRQVACPVDIVEIEFLRKGSIVESSAGHVIFQMVGTRDPLSARPGPVPHWCRVREASTEGQVREVGDFVGQNVLRVVDDYQTFGRDADVPLENNVMLLDTRA